MRKNVNGKYPVQVQLSQDEYEKVRYAAFIEGVTVNAYLRDKAVSSAVRKSRQKVKE